MKSTLDVCQRLDFDAQVYSEYSQSIKKFSQAIWTYITTEVEAQSHLFSPLCQILDEFSDCNASICKVIRRSIEDLRDIAERNIVIQRKISEHALLIKEYENAKLKVEEAKKNLKLYESRSDYYLKKESLENSIKELENEQKEATRKARDGTLSLIEDKKKFSNFTARRIKSCFERLGSAFKTNSEQSIILLNRYVEGLKAIQNGNQLPNFVLYGQGDTYDLNPNIKDSVIRENENEYILCEKLDNQNISNENNNTNDNQNESNNEISSNENINSKSDNETQNENNIIIKQEETMPNENNLDIKENNESETQNENNIINKQEEAMSNENNLDIKENNENETQNENNITTKQEEVMPNENHLDIKENETEPNESPLGNDFNNQMKNDSNENANEIDANNDQEEIDLNENNNSTTPTSNF